MNVQRTAPAAFTAEFENEQELRDEHRVNLSFGALRLLTAESIALRNKPRSGVIGFHSKRDSKRPATG